MFVSFFLFFLGRVSNCDNQIEICYLVLCFEINPW